MEEHHDLFLELVMLGNVDGLRQLTQARANPDAADGTGKTPLHLASFRGQLPIVKCLVEELQANVELKDKEWGWTALHFAVHDDNLLVVKYLAETGGANIEAQAEHGNTVLHRASREGHQDVVLYLVEQRQANVNATNKWGQTPLHLACIQSRRRKDVIRFLLPRTSHVRWETLDSLWKNEDLMDLRRMVMEKYFHCQGLATALQQNPVNTLLRCLPLWSPKDFQYAIKLFPSSALSILDEQHRLSIHVALTSNRCVVKSPSVVGLLFEREPRSASSRDPTTRLYPHEATASLVDDDDDDDDDDCWFDLVYKMFRSNPQYLLQSRTG